MIGFLKGFKYLPIEHQLGDNMKIRFANDLSLVEMDAWKCTEITKHKFFGFEC